MGSRASHDYRARVADAIHAAAIHLLRGVRKEDERAGVGPAQLSALSVLVFAGPMRVTELARVEQVKPPTMTKVVAALEASRLVRRRPDAADARVVKLEATARGTKLLRDGRRRRVERLAAAFRELSVTELDAIATAAATIERVSTTI